MRYQQILRIWAEGRHDPAHITLTDMASWLDQTKSLRSICLAKLSNRVRQHQLMVWTRQTRPVP